MCHRYVLLVREQTENNDLARKLIQTGFKPISYPIIEYKNLLVNYSRILAHYSNIILTSKYAAKILYRELKSIDHDNIINIWIVGKASAAIFNRLKFIKIRCIGKNIADLMLNIPPNLYSTMIYLSADKISMELPRQVVRRVIYKTKYTATLTQDLISRATQLEYILLYSQNSAKMLMSLFVKYNLINELKNTTVITISSNVAKAVKPYLANVYFADTPTQAAMIKLLINNAKKRTQ